LAVQQDTCIITTTHTPTAINLWLATRPLSSGEEEQLPETLLVVYPYPARERISVLPQKQARIRILDLTGRLVLEFEYAEAGGASSIDLGHIPAGTYLILLISDSGIYSEKLIIH